MIDEKKLLKKIKQLYGEDNNVVNYQSVRYNNLMKEFTNNFGSCEFTIFSSPGRIELSGNHTDHNLGRVLAASINLDTIAVVSKTKNNKIILLSKGWDELFSVSLNDLKYNENEKGTTISLIRGIASIFAKRGYKIGGFVGNITSDVLVGSGLSSSASIEILIANIFNHFFNGNKISPLELSQIAQIAENDYFGKPCGLIDQLTCAVGGIVSIDFKNSLFPRIKKIKFDFNLHEYKIIVLNTGTNHVNLTEDYSAISQEMKSVAKYFGKNNLREIKLKDIIKNVDKLRNKCGDRAILRSIHFFDENERVLSQIAALKKNNFNQFLSLINESGQSSYKLLQNIYSPQNLKNQPLSLSLALTEHFIKTKGEGAVRIHGGSFAGTILVFLKKEFVEEYVKLISPIFYKGSVKNIEIRNVGSCIVV